MTTAAVPMIDLPERRPTRGLGDLAVESKAGRVTLPLAEVRISARVAERIADVTVTERFQNPHPEPLEAVYIFPLPGAAAVREFELKVGGRTVKGIVKERGEARRDYQKALEEGKRAALMEKERDDVFTVQVGNLPPGEEVTVRIAYSERLPFFEEGTTELRLPLVVAPRYIPGAPLPRGAAGDGTDLDTDAVPDASRITPPRLAPGFDPKVGLAIEVELLKDGELSALSCSQHATLTSAKDAVVVVRLAREDEPLNRDFVLRWALAGDQVKPSLLAHRGADGKAYGVVSILPPRGARPTAPRDIVFVLDRSGSMGGPKMASAARACALLLATLGPGDRFAIEAFDNVNEWMPLEGDVRFTAADEAAIAHGERYLRGIGSRGGTEMLGALTEALAALSRRAEQEGRVSVIVLLTDGQVGDESRVLKEVQRSMGAARVFTIGIDTAPNDTFLKRLADLGGGTSSLVSPGAALEEALRSIGRDIGSPLIVDVTLEDVDAGLDASSLAPARIPDLFAGRATSVFFRAAKTGRVRVKGRYTGAAKGLFAETLDAREIALPALAQLWARARVADLEDRFRIESHGQDAIKGEIVRLSVAHSILTRFTAFIAVDETEVVNAKGERRKVVQPVEMPDRWEMPEQPPAMTMAYMAAPSMPSMADRAAGRVAMAASTMPPSAPSTRTAAGILSRAGRVLLDVLRAGGEGQAGPGVPPRAALENALRLFVEAFAELKAGRWPAAARLKEACAELVASLSGMPPSLRKVHAFFTGDAFELIAALEAHDAGFLASPLFARLEKTFEEARQEAVPFLAGGGKSAFWEASV